MAAPTKKGPGHRKPAPRISLLSPEEKEALRKQARASVAEEMAQDARDEYFRRAIDEARREHVPADQIIHVTMDLAPFIAHVMIDGVQYFHGYGYDVPRQRAVVLYEQMQRSWMHQDEIDGRSRFNPYRRPQNVVIGPRSGVTTASALSAGDFPENMEI